MATISKFYLHDAATTNTGIMPGASDAFVSGLDATGDATGARTARLTNDTIGTLQASAVNTATANLVSQNWGLRRFVSPPLAATTFAAADGNWTFSVAVSESNTNHNGLIAIRVGSWRPSTGAIVQSSFIATSIAISSTSETATSVTAASQLTTSILDGDILFFQFSDNFTQSKSTAYTSSFFYDGTTEASATSCASFVTPPAALALFTPSATLPPSPVYVDSAVARSTSY